MWWLASVAVARRPDNHLHSYGETIVFMATNDFFINNSLKQNSEESWNQIIVTELYNTDNSNVKDNRGKI